MEEQIKLAAKLMNISEDDAKKYCHAIEGSDALYFSIPVKGGDSLIVGTDGQVLYANSSVEYERHLEEYKKGTRTPLELFI